MVHLTLELATRQLLLCLPQLHVRRYGPFETMAFFPPCIYMPPRVLSITWCSCLQAGHGRVDQLSGAVHLDLSFQTSRNQGRSPQLSAVKCRLLFE